MVPSSTVVVIKGLDFSTLLCYTVELNIQIKCSQGNPSVLQPIICDYMT